MNAPERLQVYAPLPGSLARRVLGWFTENPEEELTARDIAAKFGLVNLTSICQQLQPLVASGALVRTAERPSLYRLPAFMAGPRKRLYLSGPMTGHAELNFPAFHAAAARLRALGYVVVNPAELNPNPKVGWHACMRADLKALLECDAICLLQGWEQSSGAHLEMHVAHRVGIRILQAGDLVGECATGRGRKE